MAKVYFAGFVPAEEGGYYISIPDVPNAFTEADTLEDGMKMATDVLSTMLRDFVKNGRPTPEPSPLPEVQEMLAQELEKLDFKAAGEILYQLIQAPSLEMVPVKISISFPRAVLSKIDAKAKAYGFTRSGFLAHAAQAYLREKC